MLLGFEYWEDTYQIRQKRWSDMCLFCELWYLFSYVEWCRTRKERSPRVTCQPQLSEVLLKGSHAKIRCGTIIWTLTWQTSQETAAETLTAVSDHRLLHCRKTLAKTSNPPTLLQWSWLPQSRAFSEQSSSASSDALSLATPLPFLRPSTLRPPHHRNPSVLWSRASSTRSNGETTRTRSPRMLLASSSDSRTRGSSRTPWSVPPGSTTRWRGAWSRFYETATRRPGSKFLIRILKLTWRAGVRCWCASELLPFLLSRSRMWPGECY